MNGLDKHISDTIQLLTEKLWVPFNNSFLGRSVILEKKGNKQPYVYDSNNEYQEVLVNDNYNSIVHFYELPDKVERIGNGVYKSTVYIMFAVDLTELYGNDTSERERAVYDAEKVIKYSPFKIQSIAKGVESYDIYDLVGTQTNKFNMQPYFVFRFETEIIYSLNVACGSTTTTDTFDVNTTIVGNGSINSNPETLTDISKNTLVSLNATADDGNRFVNWLVSGVSYTNRLVTFYITKTTTAIANFIERWNLTTSVDGDGTISPASGTYDDGDIVSIVAEPTDPETTELSSIKVNDIEVSTTSPYSLLMDAGKVVIAYFNDLLTLIQDVFTTATIDNEFVDLSGYENNVQIKNVQVGYFDSSTRINSGLTLTGQSLIDFEIHYTPDDVTATRYIIATKATSTSLKGILLFHNTANTLLLYISDGSTNQSISIQTLTAGTDYIIKGNWNGLIGGTITTTVNDVVQTFTATKEFTIESAYSIHIGFSSSSARGLISYAKMTNYFEYVINHGQGLVIYDISGLGNNGTLSGTTAVDFYAQTQDVDSFEYSLGVTLYENDADQTILPICFETSQTISGLTRIGWYPAGSGLFVKLNMLYTFSGVNDVIPDGDYTGLELYNLAQSDNLVKEQTEHIISSLKVFSLASEVISLITTNEGYLITEEDDTNNLIIEE